MGQLARLPACRYTYIAKSSRQSDLYLPFKAAIAGGAPCLCVCPSLYLCLLSVSPVPSLASLAVDDIVVYPDLHDLVDRNGVSTAQYGSDTTRKERKAVSSDIYLYEVSST